MGVNISYISNEKLNVNVQNPVVKDTFSGSTNVTKTYQTPMRLFSIKNDGEVDLTFTINGFVITVKPKEPFEEEFAPFTQVSITTTSAFRALVKG